MVSNHTSDSLKRYNLGVNHEIIKIELIATSAKGFSQKERFAESFKKILTNLPAKLIVEGIIFHLGGAFDILEG